MQNINRKIVKTQSKNLIKNNVFSLFVLSFLTSLLTNGFATVMITKCTYVENYSVNLHMEFWEMVISLIGFLFCTLSVTVAGFFVSFIRSPEDVKLGEAVKNVFEHSYDKTFLNKFLVFVLQSLFQTLWSFLFVIPGIVYHYHTFFAYQIINDCPDLKPTEALKLSKQMTKGHISELLLFDLSFIPWALLSSITLGISTIYSIPYYNTAKAIMYENFRIRAKQNQSAPTYAYGYGNETQNYENTTTVQNGTATENPSENMLTK